MNDFLMNELARQHVRRALHEAERARLRRAAENSAERSNRWRRRHVHPRTD